jgi:hypothetical protein
MTLPLVRKFPIFCVTCLFFKGIKSERTMDIDPVEMRVEWFKSREVGVDEWLKRYRNTCFHDKEPLLFAASPHGKVRVHAPNFRRNRYYTPANCFPRIPSRRCITALFVPM